ncbi:MAG: lmo0937 family membrane protein [Limisphaerales bacterium]
MLYTLAVMLVILWLLGLVSGTAGGLIHILLVIAIVAVLLQVISGRKAVLNKNLKNKFTNSI